MDKQDFSAAPSLRPPVATELEPTAPVRVQLSRAKGWRMPPDTVKVDRSTRFGNPFTVTDKLKPGAKISAGAYIAVPTVEDAVSCFREMLTMPGERADAFRAQLPILRGKNLACWCKPEAPCHADVLLELANAPEPLRHDARDGSSHNNTEQTP